MMSLKPVHFPHHPIPGTTPRSTRPPRRRQLPLWLRRCLWGLLLLTLVCGVAIGGSLTWAWATTPSVTDLGTLVKKMDQMHGAPYTPLVEVSPLIQQALIVTEDETFYSNHGIDVVGVFRAAWDDLRAGRIVEGGSTLTEQLAKEAYLGGDDHSLGLKLQDMALALKIEARYSKTQILEFYLNLVYFGEQAYGIGAAARRYFGLKPSQVDLAQAALLAGLVQAPSQDDPFCHPLAARARQHQVLDRLLAEGDITASQARAAEAELFPFWTSQWQPGTGPICQIARRLG